ncbi:MAG: BPL-N domain-containing protein [Thermodesulfovibrionales bacterium]|nr:BPL-N domain-containing protein [Thermodesulfovibrionales bacterium]
MKSPVAFLWDESYLWGLMAYESLKENNLPFKLIKAEDIKNKILSDYRLLFIPGGWASNKLKKLGEEGIKEIRDFVYNGGNYLGFCGGAGLATLDGLNLLNVKRKPTKERVPSFSGRIKVKLNSHQIWHNLNREDSNTEYSVFHVWWPSQFEVLSKEIKILATFFEAMPDSFTSDICVGDVECAKSNWDILESLYEINLNPNRLKDAPVVVEGLHGKGKVILSLVHFDTPGDIDGRIVLKNLWEYLLGESFPISHTGDEISTEGETLSKTDMEVYDLFKRVKELIDLGTRNFLWFQKNSMLFQWRRGIRGLEYCNLYILIKKLSEVLNSKSTGRLSERIVNAQLLEVKELLELFCEKAKKLLILERFALQQDFITYNRCDDPEIQQLRQELFSNSKSYGGMFKQLIDKIDELLYSILSCG